MDSTLYSVKISRLENALLLRSVGWPITLAILSFQGLLVALLSGGFSARTGPTLPPATTGFIVVAGADEV
jgi:hypothetical protein